MFLVSMFSYRKYGIFSVLIFSFLFFGCEENFRSPQPGILEIRVKAITSLYRSSHPIYRNGLSVMLNNVAAIRNDDAILQVYSDIRSTKRYPSLIDLLDTLALDSSLILGQTYTPTGEYKRVNVNLAPIGFSFFNGYQNQFIPVIDIREAGQEVLYLLQNFTVNEMKKTVVTISVDIDSSVIRSVVDGMDVFLFQPKFWISSVKVQ
ncbi:MAG: hypothetical protein FJ218_03770 [Ignavibacteria bacterium]|nr:hypothetical protein [Ignavibacteria bacterium]